jgi:hypothetical protein
MTTAGARVDGARMPCSVTPRRDRRTATPPRPARGSTLTGALVLGALAAHGPTHAEALGDVRWAILPARASRPPPRDPSLLRLSAEVESVVREAARGVVALRAPDLRDDACPDLANQCPRDVATLVRGERVLALALSDDLAKLEVRAFAAGKGPTKRLELPCRWASGLVACELEALRAWIATEDGARADAARAAHGAPARAAKPQKAPRGPAKLVGRVAVRDPEPERPPAERAFLTAIDALRPRLERCAAQGWGELARADRPAAASIRARVADGGGLRDVRLEPAALSDAPAFACMARVVESASVDAAHANAGTFSAALPLPR